MKLTLSKPIFNRIKRIATDFCNSQEIDYELMRVCGNNWFGSCDFNIVVPELLELINKAFKDSGINRTVSRGNISIIRSFGITHHKDYDKDSFLIVTRGKNYVFGYHKEPFTNPVSHDVNVGDVVYFLANEYHSLYSFKPTKQPFECLCIGFDSE